ncbi:MAG TPA: hypothetical protein VNP73_10685 [Actinomycetota bacterium]|nr:hypothetical protein [Actinomycetota bacterium]
MRRDEGGQAVVESILLCLVLLVPLIWMLGVLAELHRGALAAGAAARDAGFAAASAPDLRAASDAIDIAVRQAFVDHELDPERASVRWTSAPGLERGGIVEVRVEYPVPVARIPFVDRVAGPSIRIDARHAARIDPFRSRG